MQMDELLSFFQTSLEKDFVYDNDTVIEQLQICMEELRKARMSSPPKPKANEQPTLPFGLEIQPSVEQLIGRRTDETMDEHFRKNVQRAGGKPAYLRRKNTGASMTGSSNLLSTPEMTRSHDARSIQSRVSQYSIDDKSSYYDTATNSRLSLADYSAKTSAPSSRTSFGEASEMGSMSALGHGFTTPIDLDEVGVEVATPTTPTNPPIPTSHFNSPPPAMSQSYEMPKSTASSNQQTTVRTSSSLEMQPQTIITVYERAPRPGTISQNATRTTSSASHRSNPNTPTKTSYNHTADDNRRGSASNDSRRTPVSFPKDGRGPRLSASYEQLDMPKSSSSSFVQTSVPKSSTSKVHTILPVAIATDEDQKSTAMDDNESARSSASDYDNMNEMYDVSSGVNNVSTGVNINSRFVDGRMVTVIPISRSEGFVSNARETEMVMLNGSDGPLPTRLKMTQIEDDIQHARQQDYTEQRSIDYKNGFQVEQQTSLSQNTTSQTQTVYTRVVEKTAYL